MNQFCIELHRKKLLEVSVYSDFDDFEDQALQFEFTPYSYDEDQTLCEITKDEWKEKCKERGLSGTVINKEDIHLYLDPEKMNVVEWATVIGHEIGHALRPHHRSTQKEEKKAITRSDIVKVSMMVLMEILDNMGYEIRRRDE